MSLNFSNIESLISSRLGALSVTVTAASGNGSVVTYTANNSFSAGQSVTINGLSTAAFNLQNVTIASATGTQFTVNSSATGAAVTGATATAIANIDTKELLLQMKAIETATTNLSLGKVVSEGLYQQAAITAIKDQAQAAIDAFNASVANYATKTGAETLTNKTLTSPIISNATFTGQQSGLEIAFNNSIVFEGTTADSNELTLSAGEPTADRTVTLPNATTTLVGTDTTDTLTNKSINLANNTLTTTLAQLNTAISDADVAALESPAFTGTPTAPTATAGTTTTQIATTAFVATAISNVISSAPDLLNTLQELSAAINNDANFFTTINTALNAKAPSASPTFTGTVTLPSTTSIGDVSATEIGYLNNVTSSIQTQLDNKAPLASPTFTGTVTFPAGTSGANLINIPNSGLANSSITIDGNSVSLGGSISAYPSQGGNSGKFLTTNGSSTSWGTPYYQQILVDGTGSTPQRTNLNFVGATVTDDLTNNRTTVTINPTGISGYALVKQVEAITGIQILYG